MPEPDRRPVLVTDFDGTMTERDYYKLVRERLMPRDAPDYWGMYQSGELTHFEALREIFGYPRTNDEALRELAREAGLDPGAAEGVAALRASGWEVIVASAGCRWYIDVLLGGAGIDVEVVANPGHVEDGQLRMEFPTASPFPSEEMGVDKAALVRSLRDEGRTVAYAGDSRADVKPALVVPGELRFARDELAGELRTRSEAFRPFERWSEVARALAGGRA